MITNYEEFRGHAATSSNKRGDYIASSCNRERMSMPGSVSEVVVHVIPDNEDHTAFRVEVSAYEPAEGGKVRNYASVSGFVGKNYRDEFEQTVNHSGRGSCDLEETLFYAGLIQLAASTVEYYGLIATS